ncbi:putative transferase CAF17 homolog, mitochondrial isoform X1 [Conger conger]|uniref:putative transferase CAF17 homolog, mitochondrial isoform X1 n=1 Tax=Conger conger TaxID=82655 RepID=UPI002A59DD80|nr:putative transferase CAF17 homolog, mitochondrial isoform X1 [Conger conger]
MSNVCLVHSIVGVVVFRNVFRLGLNTAHAVLRRVGYCNGKLDRRNCRHAHSEAGPKKFVCYSLPHRTLIKVQGQDTGSFLQGLVTNDMDLLTKGMQTAMYTHMLNIQGRTIFDIIMYSLKAEQEGETRLLLECDSSVQDALQRHMKMYKIRRKVTISPCADLSLWAVVPRDREGGGGDERPELTAPEKALVWELDPRTKTMGWRLVTDKLLNPLELMGDIQQGETEHYHRHRYNIGLPEGVKDLPPGVALPLESNLVYMQGISFSKGCYIGQELTARTHHTGVVRKRLMPVRLSPPAQVSAEGADLCTESGKPAGKHRADVGEVGLSLVRLAQARETLLLKPSPDTTLTVKAWAPDWWPKDPKAK